MASPSEKQKRYDRQLRLWGEHGQVCMEECTVCLINGTGCGAEALKNLVLPGTRQSTSHCTALQAAVLTLCCLSPGIGSFTIVDGANVSEADLGNNFFVEQSSLGTSRAACVTRLLQELNEHVTGSYVAEDISQVRRAAPACASAAAARDTSVSLHARRSFYLGPTSCTPLVWSSRRSSPPGSCCRWPTAARRVASR